MASAEGSSSIRGFVAGALSGVAKVSTGHPFDTIKVRLQTSPITRFSGPWSCLCQTLYHDGVRGLYKGMTPPLVGFVFMDSLLLGSFSVYRDFLNRIVQHPKAIAVKDTGRAAPASLGSASVSFIAGGLAGWTVSFIAAPIEHVKARLQVQDGKSKYSSPTDCFRKIYRSHGIPGLYRGLSATIIFRSFFAFFWGSYDILNRTMQSSTSLSVPLINFIAAGIAAQLYWLTGYPTDVIKQRIMTGPLGGVTNDKARRLARWKGVARSIYAESGWRGFWRGFLPCFLRAFPANAMSIVTFEAVMRTTTYAKV